VRKRKKKKKTRKSFLFKKRKTENLLLLLLLLLYSPATSTPSSLFFSAVDAATLGAVRHRRGESTETSVSGLDAKSSMVELFLSPPSGALATARRAARLPSATRSCRDEPSEPWTRLTAGSEQRRDALFEARASYHAPPPGKGAVGSGEAKRVGEVEKLEDEEEGASAASRRLADGAASICFVE